MTAMTFDTLAYSRTLQAAGVPVEQAEAMTNAQKAALNEMMNALNLATKKDLSDRKVELIRWTVGSIIAQSALLVAAIAFLR